MISNSSTKSSRCIGNSCPSASARSSGLSAKIISRMTVKRSCSKNMCSVRHSPMPWASNLRAMRASAGVSALARTPISQISPAHCIRLANAASTAASCIWVVPTIAWPELPSMVIISPSLKTLPSLAVMVFSRLSICIPIAPTTQGRPKPRAITAAWLVMPPRMVRTATAAFMPRTSSGVVSPRTKTHGSPRAALACASFEPNTIRPLAAPGLAAIPVSKISRLALGAICGCSNFVKACGSMRIRASWWLMISSCASSTAIRTAAREFRGMRTASRMFKTSFETVNSICISSRRRVRHNSPHFSSSA